MLNVIMLAGTVEAVQQPRQYTTPVRLKTWDFAQDGRRFDQTLFVDVPNKYGHLLQQGKLVSVRGKLQRRSYEPQGGGEKKWVTEVRVFEVTPYTQPQQQPQQQQGGYQGGGGGHTQAMPPQQQQQQPQQQQGGYGDARGGHDPHANVQQSGQGGGGYPSDDQIPFAVLLSAGASAFAATTSQFLDLLTTIV